MNSFVYDLQFPLINPEVDEFKSIYINTLNNEYNNPIKYYENYMIRYNIDIEKHPHHIDMYNDMHNSLRNFKYNKNLYKLIDQSYNIKLQEQI